MSRQEVIDNIGTIAKSGTREFFQALTGDQRKDATLIGQFGVGFYSSFIVADRVTLTTRRAGLPADAGRALGVRPARATTPWRPWSSPQRGTEVILHLREDEDELLDGYRLRSIIRKYSDHISLPIVMPAERRRRGRRGAGRGDRQPGLRAVERAQERDHRRGVQRVLQAHRRTSSPTRWPACTARMEGKLRVHPAALHPLQRALRPVEPRQPPRRQALRAPRLHHGRRRAADAALPALRARRDRLQRPAAERLARDPAAAAGSSRRSATAPPRRCSACCKELATDDAEKYATVLEGVRRGPQGGRGRGPRQPGGHRQAAALHLHRQRRRRARMSRWTTTWRA